MARTSRRARLPTPNGSPISSTSVPTLRRSQQLSGRRNPHWRIRRTRTRRLGVGSPPTFQQQEADVSAGTRRLTVLMTAGMLGLALAAVLIQAPVAAQSSGHKFEQPF